MIPTLVIGLREGLEAALIVGIIAAFLRRNGKSLVPMWIGVAAAVALSVGVGIALRVIEQSLPQAGQEGMESIIGAVAVVFVTGMIVWMNTHSRGMKRELEAQAGEALHDGHALALAGMAFLAVLKEGFETSVFLLATFSASSNGFLAAAGAVIGVVVAVIIGIGIYAGSVKLNLSTFFRATGVFLILVAAGLVLTALRTAHEAGWLNAGQQQVLDLGGIVAPGTVQAALITGVLGIPADPRLIEVIGWLAYLVPVAAFVYWPAGRRAKGAAVARVQFGIAGAVAACALVLAVAVPQPHAATGGSVALVAADATTDASPLGTATLRADTLRIDLGGTTQSVALPAASARSVQHEGLDAVQHTRRITGVDAGAPAALTLAQLVELSGGRLPVGVNATQNPGPFDASWSASGTTSVWTVGGALLDAQQDVRAAVTISGGGLGTPRTFSLSGPTAAQYAPVGWQLSGAAAQRAADAAGSWQSARTERALWAVQLPIGLAAAALALLLAGIRSRRRARAAANAAAAPQTTPLTPTTQPEAAAPQRSTTYAAH